MGAIGQTTHQEVKPAVTNPSTTAVRVAIYAQVATVAEQADGLKTQEDACRSYAEARGWTVADGCQDQGASARPGFARLLEDVGAGLVDTVLVEDSE